MYDEVYFDSDSEEEDKPGWGRPLMTSSHIIRIVSTVTKTGVSSAGSSTGRRQKQRIIKSNDELLYDPDEDDRDQAWVDARRRR